MNKVWYQLNRNVVEENLRNKKMKLKLKIKNIDIARSRIFPLSI